MHLKKFSIQAKLLKASQSNPMTFIQYGELDTNILYIDAEPLTSVSLQIRSQIRQLKKFASERKLIGFSALQGGYADKFFIVSKEAQSQEGKWTTSQVYPPDQFLTIINPKITEICMEGAQKTEVETSPTFPMLEATVPRYLSIKVRYFNEDMDEVEETLKDFESRTFQHFQDFIMNKDLLNWRVNQGNICITPPYLNKLKKFSAVLDDYKKHVGEMKEQFPQYFTPRQLSELNKPNEFLFMPSFEVDMMRRLLKNIRKDLRINVTQEQLDQIMG